MVSVYTTIPVIKNRSPRDYLKRLSLEAKWAESAGIRGMLVVSDNASLDPWAAAQLLIGATERLVPLVAVNTVYMHPFSVARTISSLGFLCERTVHLNYVNGGFQRHLDQVGCELDHDERYDQLAECAEIVARLLRSPRPVTYNGKYFQVKAATVTPRLDPAFLPEVFVSGTSDKCRAVQQRLAVTRLAPPRQIDSYQGESPLAGTGVRLGIIAREVSQDAWRVARNRFPVDSLGEKLHEFSAGAVHSNWHLALSADAIRSAEPDGAYWLYPFRSYQTLWPYLVGSYAEVAELLARYLEFGVTAIVLDELYTEDDAHHAMLALEHAERPRAHSS